MKYSKCSVPGCNSNRQDVILHKFPKCEKNLQRWKDSISCEALSGLSVAELSRLQVCHKHFEQRFVTEKSRILGNAYPTLFSPEHSYSKKIQYDHTYHKLEGQEATTSAPGVATTSHHVDPPPLQPISQSVPEIATGSLQQECVKRKKLVQSVEALTPKCRHLYKEYRKTKKLPNYTRRIIREESSKVFQ